MKKKTGRRVELLFCPERAIINLLQAVDNLDFGFGRAQESNCMEDLQRARDAAEVAVKRVRKLRRKLHEVEAQLQQRREGEKA